MVTLVSSEGFFGEAKQKKMFKLFRFFNRRKPSENILCHPGFECRILHHATKQHKTKGLISVLLLLCYTKPNNAIGGPGCVQNPSPGWGTSRTPEKCLPASPPEPGNKGIGIPRRSPGVMPQTRKIQQPSATE